MGRFSVEGLADRFRSWKKKAGRGLWPKRFFLFEDPLRLEPSPRFLFWPLNFGLMRELQSWSLARVSAAGLAADGRLWWLGAPASFLRIGLASAVSGKLKLILKVKSMNTKNNNWKLKVKIQKWKRIWKVTKNEIKIQSYVTKSAVSPHPPLESYRSWVPTWDHIRAWDNFWAGVPFNNINLVQAPEISHCKNWDLEKIPPL